MKTIVYCFTKCVLLYKTIRQFIFFFAFMHLADTFIQSVVLWIQFIYVIISRIPWESNLGIVSDML